MPAKETTWLEEYVESLLKLGKSHKDPEFQRLMDNPVFGGRHKIVEIANRILKREREQKDKEES